MSFGVDGAFVFNREPGDWFMPLLNQVCDLGQLPTNWNSYGAKAVDPETAAYAVNILLDVLSESDPVPSVVPTSNGGIQFEWHEAGVDLEIEVQSPSSIEVFLSEGECDEDFKQVDFPTIQKGLDILRCRLRCADDDE